VDAARAGRRLDADRAATDQKCGLFLTIVGFGEQPFAFGGNAFVHRIAGIMHHQRRAVAIGGSPAADHDIVAIGVRARRGGAGQRAVLRHRRRGGRVEEQEQQRGHHRSLGNNRAENVTIASQKVASSQCQSAATRRQRAAAVRVGEANATM
jgi:hypothetical protein